MRKLKFMLARIINLDYKKMWKTSKKISNNNKKGSLSVFFDMISCGLKYKAGYIDYEAMGFVNLTKEERKTYLTRGSNDDLIAKYNKKEYRDDFDDKIKFNQKFEKYLKRDWLYIKNIETEDFQKFIENNPIFIAKLTDEGGGVGVEKLNSQDYQNNRELLEYLQKSKHYLIEEVVKQHEKLNELHPISVNTVRIITLLLNNEAKIVTAFLRIGNGKVIDNSSGGGMLSPIDEKTGKLLYDAYDGELIKYETHPLTNIKIKDFQVPYWKETLELVKEVALIEPNLQYIGWDIAITNNGPLLIEGNPYPSYGYYQLSGHVPKKEGLLVKIKRLEHE